MYSENHNISKRIKLRHENDRAYLHKRSAVPQKGFLLINRDVKGDKGIVFRRGETDYFQPRNVRRSISRLEDPVELYKAGLIVDKVNNIKRLKDPIRWCVLPKVETVTIEVPLTEFKGSGYDRELFQELGHVAWHKAYFHVDKEVYEPKEFELEIKQVLQKVPSKSLPRWRPRTRYWNDEFIGTIEIPGTVFCTERQIIKKLKYIKGETPDIVHHKTVAQVERDTIGCSIFRRHQPPNWTSRDLREEENNDKIWNGFESRNRWVFESLYTIWAGENEVRGLGYQWRERVYWTAPVRHLHRDEYLCHHYPYCSDTVEDSVDDEEEFEPENIEVDEDAEAW